MSWKTNHILLAEKLVKKISEDGETTFDKLEVRARQLGINLNTFDRAIALVHKLKTVKRTTVLGTVRYSIQEVKKKPELGEHVKWCLDNYPYPKVCSECRGSLCASCFPFYDPAIDTITKIKESLYMTREEYKAASEGKTFVPKKKYQYANA